MAQIVVSRKAAQQIAKFRKFYRGKDPDIGERATRTVVSAFQILGNHPAIGRPAIDYPELRELIIPFGGSGYVALYRIDRTRNRIVILAVRHQREAGYEARD